MSLHCTTYHLATHEQQQIAGIVVHGVHGAATLLASLCSMILHCCNYCLLKSPSEKLDIHVHMHMMTVVCVLDQWL